MRGIVNLAAYKFVSLDSLKARRESLRQLCRRQGLKGTILLSPEGINLFVAGSKAAVHTLLEHLGQDPRLADLQVKTSYSDQIPFRRMLVKIKREIIAFGVAGVEPAGHQKLPPTELKRWLDEGRDVLLLDTRNNYEVRLGTFQNARNLNLDHFRNFPERVRELSADLKQKPVVMFCTGGIRCEKAGPWLEQQGFQQVLQLEGGILKYFEECGGEHYRGECFVFDQRVALDSALRETPTTQCFVCQEPLTLSEQQSESYVPGKSCPYCYQSPEQELERTIGQREAAIRRLTRPLPGSVPQDNFRPMNVPARCDGMSLIDFLSTFHPHVRRQEWLEEITRGRIVTNGQAVPAQRQVRAGERLSHLVPAQIEPDVNPAIRILYEDRGIVIVDKPAPLPLHPSGRFHRNTLSHLLNRVYSPEKLRPAHRLDANTTGVLVLSRSRQVASLLQPQFEQGNVEKVYLARVCGLPAASEFECDAPVARETSQLGGREIDPAGLPALTRFRVLERFRDGTGLLEARPLTGRTNQIRLHLWSLGWPVLGDPFYLGGGRLGEQQTLEPAAPPLCLHARSIAFRHPLSGERVCFEAPLPDWAADLGSERPWGGAMP